MTFKVFRLSFLLVFLSLLVFLGCSATPSYLANVKVDPLIQTTPSGSEKTVLKPTQVNIEGKEVDIPPSWEFEYDLSVLPSSSKIIGATFEAYALDKKVLAKSLGNKQAAHLAPMLVPTSFFGSRLMKSGSQGVGASDSTVTWKSGGLKSIAARIGGTGGAGLFVLEKQGWDRWNVTEICNKAMKGTKTLTFYIGWTESEIAKFKKRQTIFSTRVTPEPPFIYAGNENEKNAPRLIIVYQEI